MCSICMILVYQNVNHSNDQLVNHSIDEWKEKLWVAEKVYTREDVPTCIQGVKSIFLVS